MLVVSAIWALLFHWRILPVRVRRFAWLLQHALGVGVKGGLRGCQCPGCNHPRHGRRSATVAGHRRLSWAA
jgi:hypothetical protein